MDRRGRCARAGGLPGTPAIDATAAFRASHEAAARRNLAEAMARLDRGGAAPGR